MKRENLKPNEVGAPTIFIGVGGAGSEIVRRVAEMCRPKERENINFVCLDTNVNDLLSVQKSKANIYYVQTSNTQTVGDYLDYDVDARRNWFPKNAVMYDKTVSEGAGQVRAISRLAFNATIKTGQINPLYEAVDDLFRKNGQDMKQALRVVIASTASGGTGSGIILPLSMFIRDYVKNKYPNTALIVRSLIMLPETLDSVISSTQERESQRRNAYATIKEINAFMMKGSGFFDIDEDLKRYVDMCVDYTMPGGETKSLALLPMDFCFLMDGQDAEDSTMISLTQYKKQAAQALYEQNIGPMQKKAFSVEDNIIKELSNPGNVGRNRFGGIGSSVLRYPYEELCDYVACAWALDNIGGENEAGKWGKYDKAFEVKQAEARKKGIPASEAPKLEEVYISTLDAASDPFSKDVKTKFLTGVSKSVTKYFGELQKYMYSCITKNTMIREAANDAAAFAEEEESSAEENRGEATSNLELLRSYEVAVRMNAQKVAESEAEALFDNEAKTVNEKRPYTVEALLKNTYDEVAHPVAARYVLYLAMTEFNKRITSVNKELEDLEDTLFGYSSSANDQGSFDVKFTRKTKEQNLDQMAKADKKVEGNANILTRLNDRFQGKGKYYESLNAFFQDYFASIKEFGEKTAELAAYKQGLEFLKEICKMYERFFASFKEKVSSLNRTRDDLVDEIKFVKGDSVLNVCSEKAVMDELCRATSKQSAEGAMLDNDLNGAIYDAVKANVAFEREIRYADVVEEDKRVDIFDDIVLGYFKKSVREQCRNLDVNIVEALALEYRLQARLKTREEQGDDKQVVDHVSSEDSLRHIKSVLAMGERLAAPGIQRIRNEEPREVRCVAYNRSLDAMRNYRMSEMFGKGVGAEGCDTISKYEMHFFIALYNLTPDKLNKFASPAMTETRVKNAGLYHNAYMNYSKYLGPDSTKNMMISTHIDKRWDSIAFMPELDFGFMKNQMMKIHQSLIYALLYGAIQQKNLSSAAGGKKVFRYENSEERTQDLIVSNGTLCDEFYEILDALYIDASVVEDIGRICKAKKERDQVRNSNYENTLFALAVKDFKPRTFHDEQPGIQGSLFEIPLVYYNTLPNGRRFTGEISGLVEAVIQTFEDELNGTESSDDAPFLLCDILQEQFYLLMANYEKYESLNKGKAASDNMVIDTIFRKLRHVIGETPEPDDYNKLLDDMKARIK
ncbi:MAG: tubulin-like doman-containing protein [Clostridiales bacterium]|nr:tubulin-like doman-containing protein [Clostridiales bacterium]